MFSSKYERDLAKHLESLRAETPLSPDQAAQPRRNYFNTYGGPWLYNQTVGWLRLFVLGTQIRGDLWMSARKRFVRRSIRDLRPLTGDYFNVQCSASQSSDEIRRAVESELLEFERTYRRGRLVLDLECFCEVAPHIDWRSLVSGVATS
jgi:hypothetical protein